MNDRPIDVLIGMHRDIPEADSGLHLSGERFIDHGEFGQRIKCSAHRIRGGKRGTRNDHGCDVDAKRRAVWIPAPGSLVVACEKAG